MHQRGYFTYSMPTDGRPILGHGPPDDFKDIISSMAYNGCFSYQLIKNAIFQTQENDFLFSLNMHILVGAK